MNNSSRWIVPTLVVLLLAALALSAEQWMPVLLQFVEANSNVIQGLTDLIQLVLWGLTGLAVLLGIRHVQKIRSSSGKAAH
ncbi:MAG: hypothetical protein WA865_05805 [Spirulinaceae cyanobacterium]